MADHNYGKRSLAKAEANFRRITRMKGVDPARELEEVQEKLDRMRQQNLALQKEILDTRLLVDEKGEEAEKAIEQRDAANIQIADLTARLKALETAGAEIADFVNATGDTIVDRVENIRPRFTDISYAAIEYGAALALGAVKARTGLDFKDLHVIDEDIVEAMVANSDAMEPAGDLISAVVNPHHPIAKACNKCNPPKQLL